MIVLVFWLSVIGILYTYIIYPLLIAKLSKNKKPTLLAEKRLAETVWPALTLIVPVHNEADRIAAKIQNIDELDYPKEKLFVLFVSDGSEDDTEHLLSQYESIDSICYQPRQGKPYALNQAVAASKTDILVFADVRQMIAPDAIKHLIWHLMPEEIGAVSGELCFYETDSNTGKSLGLYWHYEKWIRRSESLFFSTVGVTGALYGLKKSLYVTLPEDLLLDDLWVPMHIVKQGYRVLFCPEAKMYDKVQEDADKERFRKIRTLVGNFQLLKKCPWLWRKKENPIFWQYFSHKVLRLLMPYFMLVALISSLLLSGMLYKVAAGVQLLFYGVAIVGYHFRAARRNRVVNFFYVFVELNWIAVLALYKFLFGQVEVRWRKT